MMAYLPLTALLLGAMLLTGCSVIGDIFQAGVWTGVGLIVLIAAAIVFGIAKLRK